MFLPYRLLAQELKRSNCWKEFLHYQKAINKLEINSLRIEFLENCKRSDLIPRFLKFRIPNNGCFDEKSVHDFQRKLLTKELLAAKENVKQSTARLNEQRNAIKSVAPVKCLPSIALYVRISRSEVRQSQCRTHNKKLLALSKEQGQPLFNVKNTVITHELDNIPPTYVMQTLSLGPKNAVLDKFEPKDILAELDLLLGHCKSHNVSDETITDINVKTLAYIKKCKKLKSNRNITLTRKYLKEHKLVAVPFDKGIGICIMKEETYKQKLDTILELPQFEKYVPPRINAIHPVLKEEERIIETLKTLRDSGKIDNSLYRKLKPKGSQPARLYGTAKVHKTAIPARPVLSMPGSAYHKIGDQVAQWLSTVPECGINTSTRSISSTLKDIQLEDDEEIVSFDVSSLYTNVPVMEAINVCADLLYNGQNEKPPVDKQTFIELAKLSSCNVIMSTHAGYYKQVDGLAMGSPPAPHFANGWMSQFDNQIKGDAKLFARYMDDILRNIKRSLIQSILNELNNLHPALKFTIECEQNGRLPFLDMLIIRIACRLYSTWYSKPTDTGLIMNYHALAPRRYKRSVVSGFVYRIHNACSTWLYFSESMEKAKQILEKNQYPPSFYEPIVEETLSTIIANERGGEAGDSRQDNTQKATSETVKHMIFIQYRGKCTEDYARALHKMNAPCAVVMTLRKLKTVMPSLKPPVEMSLRSGVVYKMDCPRCLACYVGCTTRHWLTRFKENVQPSKPMGKHLRNCHASIELKDTQILASCTRSWDYLLALEALFINEHKPTINTKDEYKRRILTIKL